MAGIGDVKDLVRPPFATYDVVVYFGCGFFALPFIFHYVGRPPSRAFALDYGVRPDFVGAVMATLTLLFSVYILGHVIAYLGSQLVQKTMDSWFGKTSSVVCLMAPLDDREGTKALKERVLAGFREATSRRSWFSGWVRLMSQLPVWPAYLGSYALAVLGFYRTRVTARVLAMTRERLSRDGLQPGELDAVGGWFKPLEARVMNTNPAATARMYNYLIISGLFRSVCVILLAADWAEMIACLRYAFGFRTGPGLAIFEGSGLNAHLVGYVALTIVFVFCAQSYLKFQRRYVEEAIFSYCFQGP